MIFIETPIFTEAVCELLADDDYAAMQQQMSDDPLRGDLIRGSGGLRKMRWSREGSGKRGGVRVIYYFVTAAEQIRLIYIYAKGIKDNLSPRELAILRRLNEGWG